MKLDEFFRDELSWLRRQGADFSRAWPQLTRFLAEKSADPDVERLLEGFAFLSGTLRAKIEDDFPELTHGLLNILWPNYLRPVPSFTIIECQPKVGSITEACQVKKGIKLGSKAIKGTACTFSTCRDIGILPVELTHLTMVNTNENGCLTLSLKPFIAMPLDKIGLENLRLFLGSDYYVATQLYLYMLNHLKKVTIKLNGAEFALPNASVSPVGFSEHDALLPYPKNVYSGYRILQEFFCFPEGFLFVDINGFDPLPQTIPVNDIELCFHYDKPFSSDCRITPSSIKLNCVPAANLFEHHAEPIQLDGKRIHYPLKASHMLPEHYEVFSVEKVEGWKSEHAGKNGERTKGELRTYHAFETFKHEVEFEKKRTMSYFKVSVCNSLKLKGYEHNISFLRSDENILTSSDEIVAVKMLCTNRNLPAELSSGEICLPLGDSPPWLAYSNISLPSQTLRPLIDEKLHWTLISSMALNYHSLLDKDALLQIIRNYDFPAMNDQHAAKIAQKRFDGVEKIDTKPVDRLIRGMPVRGIHSTLFAKQSAFLSEGEFYLFGCILARFLSLFSTINSFHELSLIDTENNSAYHWPLQQGSHSLI
jgi:type VI secretion system protein ImpG